MKYTNYCHVEASIKAHLDWEASQEAHEAEEEREYWESGRAQEDQSLEAVAALEPVDRLEAIEETCIECWSV